MCQEHPESYKVELWNLRPPAPPRRARPPGILARGLGDSPVDVWYGPYVEPDLFSVSAGLALPPAAW